MRAFLLKLRRGETPFYAALRPIAVWLIKPHVTVPGFIRPFFGLMYHLHWGIWRVLHNLVAVFYAAPLFSSRCERVGRRLFIFITPHVVGHTRIFIGDNVSIFGKVGIVSGRVHDDPELRIGNNVHVGHLVKFFVNQQIIVEDNVNIASHCTISDNDGHPLDPDARARNEPPPKSAIAPVRIGRDAWLGEGCHIRKGVTIGAGAIIGVNSVVLRSVPDNCIVMGNPAKVVGFAGVSSQKELKNNERAAGKD